MPEAQGSHWDSLVDLGSYLWNVGYRTVNRPLVTAGARRSGRCWVRYCVRYWFRYWVRYWFRYWFSYWFRYWFNYWFSYWFRYWLGTKL